MSSRSKARSTGWKVFGCASAIIIGIAAMVGGLAIALMGVDFDLDFGNVDADPGKGTESERLAVTVTPRTGLTDGAVVTVTSDAFEPGRVVGVAVCLPEADTDARGVDACDEVRGARYAVSPEGKLSATYPVPRVITIGGVAHDCAASRTSSCIVVAADASDYDRSGGEPISFRSDLGTTDLAPSTVRAGSDRLAVIPPDAGVVTVGSRIEVTASGFQPGEPVLMAHCSGFPREPVTSCDPLNSSAAMTAIMFRSVTDVNDTADETGTVKFTFDALASFERFSSGDDTPIDCADPEAECSFVIAAAADTKRSAVVPYTVAR